MTVSGRTPKTSGTIIPISFFPADSISSRFGGVADILRLGPQDIRQGCSALHCHDHPVNEPDQGAQIGPGRELLQGFDQWFSGPGFAKNQLKFLGQFALCAAADPVQCAGGTFTRADGECHQFGEAWELRHHPLLPPLDLGAQPVVPEQESSKGTAQYGDDCEERIEPSRCRGEYHQRRWQQ